MNNKGLNNKGFTLTELLAVILILLAISLVSITNVSASLRRNDEQVLEGQKNIARSAAKIYFYEKNTMTDKTFVKIQDLIDGGYVEASRLDKLNANYNIILCSSSGLYKYSSGTTC